MKHGFCNLSNFRVTVQKKKCYGFIIYNGIKDFGHAIVATLALGLQIKQGLAKVRAKNEA
jgi:hypothetical protein